MVRLWHVPFSAISFTSVFVANLVTDISSVEPLAATREYCALLAAAAEQGSLGVLFAAAAPCMRLYAWLGAQLKAVARDGTPYHEWCAVTHN